MKHDYSTLNLNALRLLPEFEMVRQPGTHASESMGNGCAGDPPGFPTYFTRCVYNEAGNNPSRGPQMILMDRVIENENGYLGWTPLDDWHENRTAFMRSLWKPLPLDHPRTQAWIRSTFLHHRHCYHTSGWDGKNWHEDKHFFIWPKGIYGKTPFGDIRWEEFEIEHQKSHHCWDKWRPEEQEKFIAELRSNNERVSRMCEAEATPDNHDATRIVRRYYPEFEPTHELIEAKYARPGNWWSVTSEAPKPEECPGQYSMRHPCNGSWCQWCGWHESV